jgi:hypothetical protein
MGLQVLVERRHEALMFHGPLRNYLGLAPDATIGITQIALEGFPS